MLNPSERDTVKKYLSSVFNKNELENLQSKAAHKARTTTSDYEAGLQGDFSALLNEVIAEKNQPRPARKDTHRVGDLNALQKKFGLKK